ncbi:MULTISPECIES: phage tail protein [Klebsiella pneumoniae complex]|uniref:Prophage tail fiber protein n=1 Tax=Klebsiella quasipneumoniae TaxID=1463165 RepID=A0ABD7N809_9ENTR|nr:MULTISPECIES: phage tail protein [Klebsiella]MCS4375186.1 phage tail protein [Klebsiella quasipneumoniae subsp. similipneumoniae]MCS4419407.1 phage tail protein [Klebsiella quasipneumoniae subsp. similipneumoniae]SSG05968.1 putative prophage tail fiber protein [Klebsiella quasipneumoniae]SSH10706.1 putative prophage tail fiber protein [Klebsiella quasipneumoniae]VGG53196.1 putative prophage tail fiber protein [Klebsiella pneumoniae]
MSKIYKSLITVAGREKIADAIVNGDKVIFSQMSVGDGGGNATTPGDEQTALVNECFRTQLNSLKLSETNNIIIAEMIIPPEVGGFTIREAALFDDVGVCMAVANVPETYKPELAEGSGRFTVIRIWLAVSSTEAVELIVEPGIVLATVEDVINTGNEAKDYTDEVLGEHASSRDHPNATLKKKGFTLLSNAIDSDDQTRAATPAAIKAAIASAVREAWELDNPVGTTRFFNQNLNPNERWPWSKWLYTGENKTIRVGKADGSDVGATGGSDTVTLQQANLPAVQIEVSGETSEQGEQKLTTTRGGVHNHGGVAGKDDPWEIGGDVRQLFNPKELGVTDDAGEHDHEVTVPAHKHTTSGKTANLGEGKSFSVVEAHTLLMCWSRVA